jgi:hypothetical protein
LVAELTPPTAPPAAELILLTVLPAAAPTLPTAPPALEVTLLTVWPALDTTFRAVPPTVDTVRDPAPVVLWITLRTPETAVALAVAVIERAAPITPEPVRGAELVPALEGVDPPPPG